jgi:hypothetical protein
MDALVQKYRTARTEEQATKTLRTAIEGFKDARVGVPQDDVLTAAHLLKEIEIDRALLRMLWDGKVESSYDDKGELMLRLKETA